MIFATVGTQPAPFDRLLRALDKLEIEEELVVQCGSSSVRPRRATCVDYLTSDAMLDHIRRARVVVAHAGVGSVMVCLDQGKRPIVVPRLSRLGEHPDDHQHEFARRLEKLGMVTVIEDLERLRDAVIGASDGVLLPDRRGTRLVQDLRTYVVRELAKRRRW